MASRKSVSILPILYRSVANSLTQISPLIHQRIALRFASSSTEPPNPKKEPQEDELVSNKNRTEEMAKKHKKTMAELDEELRLKMEGLAGDGGAAGAELEDGQPVAMKRGVRNNMFRYI